MLRVGTDCSGIDSPIQALKELGIEFTHEFSSDIDQHCINTIVANHAPKRIFRDILTRPLEEVPDIDLYIAGFPCQPYSNAGKRKGVEDVRYKVYEKVVELINYKKPKYFILENVVQFEKHFDEKLFPGYTVDIEKLNSRKCGSLQNRKRLYIIGCCVEISLSCLSGLHMTNWLPLSPIKDDYVDYTDTSKQELPHYAYFYTFSPENVFVGLDYNGRRSGYCCTLTTKGLYNTKMGRYANITELKRIMGFPDDYIITGGKCAQLSQLGNSIEVNTIKMILKAILNI